MNVCSQIMFKILLPPDLSISFINSPSDCSFLIFESILILILRITSTKLFVLYRFYPLGPISIGYSALFHSSNRITHEFDIKALLERYFLCFVRIMQIQLKIKNLLLLNSYTPFILKGKLVIQRIKCAQ